MKFLSTLAALVAVFVVGASPSIAVADTKTKQVDVKPKPVQGAPVVNVIDEPTKASKIERKTDKIVARAAYLNEANAVAACYSQNLGSIKSTMKLQVGVPHNGYIGYLEKQRVNSEKVIVWLGALAGSTNDWILDVACHVTGSNADPVISVLYIGTVRLNPDRLR